MTDIPGDEEEPGRMEGHINAAEYWLNQAGIYNFPDPARTECLQLASIHASLAQALGLMAGLRESP
jgi:hypothetical protein